MLDQSVLFWEGFRLSDVFNDMCSCVWMNEKW